MIWFLKIFYIISLIVVGAIPLFFSDKLKRKYRSYGLHDKSVILRALYELKNIAPVGVVFCFALFFTGVIPEIINYIDHIEEKADLAVQFDKQNLIIGKKVDSTRAHPFVTYALSDGAGFKDSAGVQTIYVTICNTGNAPATNINGIVELLQVKGAEQIYRNEGLLEFNMAQITPLSCIRLENPILAYSSPFKKGYISYIKISGTYYGNSDNRKQEIDIIYQLNNDTKELLVYAGGMNIDAAFKSLKSRYYKTKNAGRSDTIYQLHSR